MLTAGIPLVQSFDIIGKGHDNPAMQKLIMAIKVDVEGGTTLADALARHPLHFDELFVNLVFAGEQAGALETLLDKIATYKEKTEAIKKKIKKALFYPAAVMVVALVVTTILLIFVIPEFENLFQGFGADLPSFTRMVIDLSLFVRTDGWWVAGLISACFATYFYMYKRSKKLRTVQDRVMLKLPIIGPILEKSCVARFARTLSTMFSAGVPLVEGLQSVAGACGNIVYEIAVLEIKDGVATGLRLQQCMENTGLFPNMVIQMIAVGEESGSLDEMSSKVADFYEDDVDNAVDGLSSLLEPMIMSILGVLVGGLVVAMYLPIFKMGAVI
jgi:type IV pilus assembly protein PilC